MGAALLLCASGSYAQNWNPAPTAESTAYSSYPAAKTPGPLNPSAIMFFI